MPNNTATPWQFTATTNRGRQVKHSAASRDKARKLRQAIERLPFVVATTTPAKAA